MAPQLQVTNGGRPKRVKRAGNRFFSFSPSERVLLKRIGRHIAADIEQRKLTLEELALRSNLARSTIREIIGGHSDPRILSLNALASALGYKSLRDFVEKATRA